ncbi:MAG: hypothetical protein ABSA21_12305 [Candidatus Limnocylindrales bacterium]|jgi:hypothetical protein
MTMDRDSTLGDDSRWLEQAGRILANLGFELVEADRLAGSGTSRLLVALRPTPTLRHFDPETIDCWTCEAGRGKASRLELESHYPISSDYSWGLISLTDRLGVSNQFLSFGGALRAQMTPDATVLVDFSSHAPILRGSGHSQGVDPLAAEVGAFFARIKVPIDFVPGAEALVAKAAPRTLYCAFIQHVREKLAAARTLRESNRWLADWSSHEAQRMESLAPEHWRAGADLRRQLGAIEAIGRE